MHSAVDDLVARGPLSSVVSFLQALSSILSRLATSVCDTNGWSRVLLSHTLDAARPY